MSHPKIPLYLSKNEKQIFYGYGTPLSSGFDLAADIKDDVLLAPGERRLIGTGIKSAIPVGYEIQIRPKSGLALNHGITVLNSPGTVDADFRSEICVILINLSATVFTIKPGMKIAQAVLCPVVQAEFHWVGEDMLGVTERKGGFGSTGLF